MTEAIVYVAIVLAAAGFVFHKLKRQKISTDEERTLQLIARSRRMFPEEDYEHDRLDKLYQPYRREWKIAMDLGDQKRAESYMRDLVLIHNAKLRALDDLLNFESQVIMPLNGKELPLCHER